MSFEGRKRQGKKKGGDDEDEVEMAGQGCGIENGVVSGNQNQWNFKKGEAFCIGIYVLYIASQECRAGMTRVARDMFWQRRKGNHLF